MATNKKKAPPKWVRLSNGVVESEEAVGKILVDLRSVAVNSPAQFEFLAQFVAGASEDLPEHLLARLRALKFVKPGDEVVLYDDVKDVIECCSEWRGNRVFFDSKNLLHADQSNIAPPDDEG